MRLRSDKILLDAHTHTLASGHAYGTIREMAAAAREQGLELLGISEHAAGIPGTCDELYFMNLEVVPRRLEGVDLLLGSEVNILSDGTLSMSDTLMSTLDYCIAGVHAFCYTDGGLEGNTQNMLRAMESPYVSIIAHPDDSTFPVDYGRIVPAAKELGVLLEVNNNSLRKGNIRRPGCEDNYRVMLELCKHYQAPVLFSSDAHDPSDVKNMSAILKYMETVDFPEELVVNLSTERFLRYITGRR